MAQNYNELIKECLQIIAKKEDSTESEIRNEIAFAVSLALKSNNPQVQNFWKEIPCAGESPTIEEIVDYIVFGMSSQS